MKNVLSLTIAFLIVAVILTVLAKLLGIYEWNEAIIFGICGSLGGTFGPITVAAIQKMIKSKHCRKK